MKNATSQAATRLYPSMVSWYSMIRMVIASTLLSIVSITSVTGQIIINEIYYNPCISQAQNCEFIELYNAGPDLPNGNKLILAIGSGTPDTITPASFPTNTYLILTNSNCFGVPAGIVYPYNGGPLANGGDSITLYQFNQQLGPAELLDSVVYSSLCGASADCMSLQFNGSSVADNSNCGLNYCASLPTPGAANFCCDCPDPGTVINLPVGFRADGTDGGEALRIDGDILRILAYGTLGLSCFDSLALKTAGGIPLADGDPAADVIEINDACNDTYIGKQFTLDLFHNLTSTSPYCQLLVNILPRIVCGTDTLACNDPFIVDELYKNKELEQPFDTCSDGFTGLSSAIWVEMMERTGTGTCNIDTIYRDWSIHGKDGAAWPFRCTDTILIDPIDYGQVFLPPSKDTLYCSDVLGLSKNEIVALMQVPTYLGNPLLPGKMYCNKMFFHSDVDTPKLCGNTFKIILDWEVYDWCLMSSNKLLAEFTSSLLILDTTPPVGNFIQEQLDSTDYCDDALGIGRVRLDTLSTGVHNCYATGNIPAATGIDSCSGIEEVLVKIIHAPAALNPLPPLQNGGPAESLIKGRYCLMYQVIDSCGNIDTLYAAIEVVDDQAPIAVCVADYNMGLSNRSGITWVNVDSLAGKYSDNCGMEAVYGRRKFDWRTACGADDPDSELAAYYAMKFDWIRNDGTPCGEVVDSGFTQYIPVCCEDVGQAVVVEILYIDQSCNTSKCWLTLHVEDKTPPTILRKLEDITLDCEVYNEHYQPFIQKVDGSFDKDSLDKYFGTYKPVVNGIYPVLDKFHLIDSTCEKIQDPNAHYNQHHYIYQRIDTSRHAYHGLFSDNCVNDFECAVDPHLDECGGWITRTFTFGGNLVLSQKIWIEIRCPIDTSDFMLPPKEITLEDCITLVGDGNGHYGGDLDTVHTGMVKPKNNGHCGTIGWGYWDKLMTTEPNPYGHCLTVLRTWCIYNECLLEGGLVPYDPYHWSDLNPYGAFIYQQKIHVKDTVKPELEAMGEATILMSNCELVGFSRSVMASDNCSQPDVSWTLSNGLPIWQGTGTTADVPIGLPAGKYHITWVAKDLCYNTTILEDTFELVSQKKPRLTMQPMMTVVLNPMDLDQDGNFDVAMGEIWGREYNVSSRNACSESDDNLIYCIVRYQSEADTVPPPEGECALFVDCSDMASNPISILVWAFDTVTHTADYVKAFLLLQDNHKVCSALNAASMVIGGKIATEMNEQVPNVAVKVDLGVQTTSEVTNNEGNFSFTQPDQLTAMVRPEKADDYGNGISTADLIRLQKHILGIKSIDTPYKMIAADANRDGKINTIDLVQLRKLILGRINSLPDNTAWRFVDKAYKFPTTERALEKAYPEYVEIDAEMRGKTTPDFVAVKIGDLNGTVVTTHAHLRQGNKSTIKIKDQYLEPGETATIALDLSEFGDLEGLQLQLLTDAHKLEIIDMEQSVEPLNDDIKYLQDGDLRVSWSLPEARPNLILELTLRAQTAVRLSDGLALGQQLAAELYTVDDQVIPLAIEYIDDEQKKDTRFYLEQNVPNPFETNTQIGFFQQGAGKVILTIYDAAGSQIKQVSRQYDTGYHLIDLDQIDLPSGLLYYQVLTDFGADTKKMLLLK